MINKRFLLIFGIIFAALVLIFLLFRKDGTEEFFQASPTIDPSILIRDETWIETNDIDIPDDDTHFNVRYDNSVVLTCNFSNGISLSMGCIDEEDTFLLLSPCVTGFSFDCGVYMTSAYGFIDTSDPFSWSAGDVISAPEIKDTHIHILLVDKERFLLIGSADCQITFDDGFYRLMDLPLSEYAYSDKDELIDTAVSFVMNPDVGPSYSFLDDSCLDYVKSTAFVEMSDTPYTSSLLNVSSETIPAGLLSNCNLIAVHLSFPGIGLITVYLAPELQSRGFSVSSTFFYPDMDYVPVAYDINTIVRESISMRS